MNNFNLFLDVCIIVELTFAPSEIWWYIWSAADGEGMESTESAPL